ncbi:FAD-dependent monooxygenase [Marivirga tractuosa]|uniref:FAD-dependent monooxygenase n=1 Tax=Marivirga tractuosa TaxID=1006 RepID=UPI0035D080F1
MEIAIIGGGIAGLTTALALKNEGISSIVYERADQLNEVGAGIWLQPNAIKVLNQLGLKEKIMNNAVKLDRVDITDSQLNSFQKRNAVVQDSEGNQILSIHRAKLQQILFEALPDDSVKLGHEFKSFSQNTSKIELEFDHTSVVVDYVLGADGINSKLRKQLFPKSALRHSGQTCWRGIAKIRLPKELQNLGREAWGYNVRFGFSQVSDDLVYWFAVAKAKPFQKDDKSKIKGQLIEKFKKFHPIVNQIINATDEQKIIRGDLLDLKRLVKWHHQNIGLIGDAAHATTPNMGQGAGQGIEDAYVMAKLFSQNQASENLFENFEKIRREKVDYVVNNSWRFGKMAHNPFGRVMMKAVMRVTPQAVINKQLEKLYTIGD